MQRLRLLIVLAVPLLLGSGWEVARAGDACGCGGEARSCVSCRHGHHCRRAGCCCCNTCGSERSASTSSKRAATEYRSAVVVPSMPVFAMMPMMMAPMGVMPASATRAAEPETRSGVDCHERINRLEKDVRDLADVVREMQRMVSAQTTALDKIADELGKKADK